MLKNLKMASLADKLYADKVVEKVEKEEKPKKRSKSLAGKKK